MATPQRNPATLRLRKLAEQSKREEAPAYRRELETRPDVCEALPPRSMRQQIGDKWAGVPVWVRVLPLVVPPIVASLVEIIRAFQ